MQYFEECCRLWEPDFQLIENRHAKPSGCKPDFWILEKFLLSDPRFRFNEEQPLNKSIERFRVLVKDHFDQDTRRTVLRNYLTKLNGTNPIFLECLKPWLIDSRKSNEWFREMNRLNGKQIKRVNFTNHLSELYRIRFSELGDFECEFDALVYANGWPRFYLLKAIGNYRFDIKSLEEKVTKRVNEVPERFHSVLGFQTKKGFGPVCYIELLNHLRVVDHEDLLRLKDEEIITRLATCDSAIKNKSNLFKVLVKEFEVNNKRDISNLQERLDVHFTKRNKFEKLTTKDESVLSIYNKILNNAKTSYKERYAKNLKTQIATHVNFIIEYFKLDHFSDFLQKPTQYQTYDQLKGLIVSFAQSRRTENEKVKSSLEAHSATHGVCDMFRFLKSGLDLPNFPVKLTESLLLKSIENTRIAADPNKGRCFSDEEINAMMKEAKNLDARTNHKKGYELILTIFREVGLRLASVCHLKFDNFFIFDSETGTISSPKEEICVTEKKKTMRRFICSENLQDLVRRHYESNKKRNGYLFPSSGSETPIASSTMTSALKLLAKNAGVKTQMHAHAFRHTLVGKLVVECGNSVELVSKFMGHRAVKTTEQHYLVPTTQQLNENMNNPFIKNKKRKQDPEDESNAKFIQARLLVHTLLRTIGDCSKKNLSASEVKNQVLKEIPDLQLQLQNLE